MNEYSVQTPNYFIDFFYFSIADFFNSALSVHVKNLDKTNITLLKTENSYFLISIFFNLMV